MKYKYKRAVRGITGSYHVKEDDVKLSPRETIKKMAAQGYRYVGNVPVRTGSYGSLAEYDMIFEEIGENSDICH